MDNKPSKAALVDKGRLAQFEPIAKLSPNRLDELADVCIVEQISKDLDPTRMSDAQTQAIYLLKGDLGIRYENGNKLILRAGTAAAKYPVDTGRLKIRDTIALTPLEVTRIDLDLIDIMMTWDQIAGYGSQSGNQIATGAPYVDTKAPEFKLDAASFNAFKLKNGVFSKVPAANIEAMLGRLTPMKVHAGQVVVTQAQEGDYYYLIQEGTAEVSRVKDPSEPPVVLAEISRGAAFGEEALASDTKRNATVTMKTDGELLRLGKQDFVELLKAPIVHYVDMASAKQKIAEGAQLLDVRFASEYQYQHLDGAINAPLQDLRSIAPTLDTSKEYIVYCQTGRRSSAAAFILAQFGIDAMVLRNTV
ncbi:MAG TPA: cyclic nucleotide-binding domain-containing protein [Methylophilus sp.]|nr:cyclic nucleotide-binding domain-containing protein [Methylophilus sp.]HQQ32856.1 cyclic nucleotide-binding domain-containing protein [Methylophilus sp.]